MADFKLEQIEILPDETEKSIFYENDSRPHTAYESEKLFFSCIKEGDLKRLKITMEQFFNNGVIIGRLSKNNLRQMQYWAVSCVTLAIRYAIEGGLNETEAYSFSDNIIRQIDMISSADLIPPYLQKIAVELTTLVRNSAFGNDYPPQVRKCINYIKQNITEKITLNELAKLCSLSPDYLSSLFKKTTGENLSRYIIKEKLEMSKTLLSGKYDYSEISCYLSFCSESYFIYCFKREYGITPREYSKSLKY